MKVQYTPRAERDYDDLPPRIRRAVDKQLGFLLQNIRYPSLQAKKYDEANDIWQARVNDDYRFYFQIVGDTCLIVRIAPHPK